MADEEIALRGGQIASPVRVGDTVRRRPGRDLALQHALLAHLAARGFAGAPRFLGRDEQGRDILTWLPGRVPYDEGDFTDSQLGAAARLLRAYHDATADFPPVLAAGAEIMCHNDWTPANAVFSGDLPYALIDFDTAAPGARHWDLAYSAWTWLDLGDGSWEPAEQRRRLGVFCAAYDHPGCPPALIAALIPGRQAGVAAWAERRGLAAGAEWARQCLAWTLDHLTEPFHPSGRP